MEYGTGWLKVSWRFGGTSPSSCALKTTEATSSKQAAGSHSPSEDSSVTFVSCIVPFSLCFVWLGKHVQAATPTHAAIELLNASSSVLWTISSLRTCFLDSRVSSVGILAGRPRNSCAISGSVKSVYFAQQVRGPTQPPVLPSPLRLRWAGTWTR
jgi:hypothetical protein